MIKLTVFKIFFLGNIIIAPEQQDTAKYIIKQQDINIQIDKIKAITDSVKVANKKWEEIEKAIIEKNKIKK